MNSVVGIMASVLGAEKFAEIFLGYTSEEDERHILTKSGLKAVLVECAAEDGVVKSIASN